MSPPYSPLFKTFYKTLFLLLQMRTVPPVQVRNRKTDAHIPPCGIPEESRRHSQVSDAGCITYGSNRRQINMILWFQRQPCRQYGMVVIVKKKNLSMCQVLLICDRMWWHFPRFSRVKWETTDNGPILGNSGLTDSVCVIV